MKDFVGKEKIEMNFKDVPKKYRPIPFWSWNEKLNTEETRRQVDMMHEVGMGGFFMHARSGRQTEYMGDEWFENVAAAVECAEKNGMRPWGYDENGWPSGFGDGIVNGLGVEYQQKCLRMENEPNHTETAICKCGKHWFYYEVNPFYVDVLDKKVVKVFIDNIYQEYYKRFGNRIEGFFSDEPQISRNGIPWSIVYQDEYQKRYGENIHEHLEELFLEIGEYKSTRFKFWKMVTDLFSSSYMKQIYDWCDERGLKFTGHLLNEETLDWQLTTSGACMPHYEYFHIPGMDWLGRRLWDNLTARQLGSAAAQTGKEAVLSETFALCGHGVSFSELKGIYEWQMVKGINLLCQHLQGYSLRGLRKRDCPPAMYYQQPWWKDYDKFIEAMSRIGMILREGKDTTDILLLHPMSTAWILYNNKDFDAISILNDKFLSMIKALEKKHIEFHLGDETIMERHAYVEGTDLVIGNCRYKKIIIMPELEMLFPTTKKLIEEFKAGGGILLTIDEVEKNPVIDNENITYTSRTFDGCKVHYFVNSTPENQMASLGVEGKRLDIYTGAACEQTAEHTFEAWGSLVIIEDGSSFAEPEKFEENLLNLDGEFDICGKVENALLLDKCDYYFDGLLQEKDGYVLNIAERANLLERKVNIRQDYHVKVEYIPETIYLVCETLDKFEISVNGEAVAKVDCGYYVDSSFRKIEISKHLKNGENTISFVCNFAQGEHFYDNLRKALIFESERNKLSYDMEIEAIYLVGDFSIKTDGKWEALERNAQRYVGDFIISEPVKKIELQDIQMQGFPFFCGSLTVSKEVNIEQNTVMKLNRRGINSVSLKIYKADKKLLTGNDKINLSELAKEGKHTLELTLTNSLRNLLGPHHLKEGESFWVGQESFHKENCIWSPDAEKQWDENYCFVRLGIR